MTTDADTVNEPPSYRLPHAVREQVEDELYRYRRTVEAIQAREDAYLSLSGAEDDPDFSLRRARGVICWSDPTGHAARQMAADAELQGWRRTVAAIDGARDAMPLRMQDAMALCFWSRNPDGSVRRTKWLAAELGLGLVDYGRLRRLILWRVACAMGMV